jgi:hypothetical protein
MHAFISLAHNEGKFLMNRKKTRQLWVFTILLHLLLTTCAHRYDNIDDFRIEALDGGKSVRIFKYAGTSQIVRIPPKIHGMSVTEIGDEAFKDKEIIKVSIPNSVIIIGKKAFFNNKLTSVTIPDSITSIEEEAFTWKSIPAPPRKRYPLFDNPIDYRWKPPKPGKMITDVSIGKGVVTIGRRAFWGNQIKTLVIPKSVSVIEDDAFAYNELTSVTISNNVSHLSGFCNNNLTNITIPDSVLTIGACAFAGNELTSVTIPDSVTTIKASAFADNELTSINIPDNVTSIEDWVFSGNKLTSVSLPNSVRILMPGTFLSHENTLTEITIGSDVQIAGGGDYPAFGAFSRQYQRFKGDDWSRYPGGFEEFYNKNNRRAGYYVNDNTGWVFKWPIE